MDTDTDIESEPEQKIDDEMEYSDQREMSTEAQEEYDIMTMQFSAVNTHFLPVHLRRNHHGFITYMQHTSNILAGLHYLQLKKAWLWLKCFVHKDHHELVYHMDRSGLVVKEHMVVAFNYNGKYYAILPNVSEIE